MGIETKSALFLIAQEEDDALKLFKPQKKDSVEGERNKSWNFKYFFPRINIEKVNTKRNQP